MGDPRPRWMDAIARAIPNGGLAPPWLRRRIETATDWAGRVTGDRLIRPGAREMLAYHRAQDPQGNLDATPGPDSHVQMLGIWAFEAFTPSNVGRVMDVMERRGWSTAWSQRSDRDLVGWLRERRRVGLEGSHELRLTRPGQARIPSIGHEADLPPFAAWAAGQMVAISPSISGLVLFFAATPEASRAIEAALRTDARTRIRSEGRSMVAVDPELARREAVEALRLGWRQDIARFFKGHAPGLFSEGAAEDYPTCELLIGDDFPLFSRDRDGSGRRVPSDIIEVVHAPVLLDAEEDEGASLAFGAFRSEGLTNHAVLASTRSAFEGTVHSLNASAGPGRHLLGANDRFRFVFQQWALVQLLRQYDQRLNAARDQASRIFRSWLGLVPLRQVQALTAGLADTAVVARELSSTARLARISHGGDYVFVHRPWRPSEERAEFLDDCRRQMKAYARSLLESSHEFNQHLSSQANLSSAQANIWIQIIVSAFAVLSLLFGGVSAWEAATNLAEGASRDRTEDPRPSRRVESPPASSIPVQSAATSEREGR